MEEEKLSSIARAAYDKYLFYIHLNSPTIPEWIQWHAINNEVRQAWYEAIKHAFEVAESLQ